MKLGAINCEEVLLDEYKSNYPLSRSIRKRIVKDSVTLVEEIRRGSKTLKCSKFLSSLTEKLLNIYPISSPEGKSLIELSEALLRTPDITNQNLLIIDKLANKDWRLKSKQASTQTNSILAYIISYCLRLASLLLTFNHDTLSIAYRSRLFLPCIRWFSKKFVVLLANQFVISETLSNIVTKDDNKYLYSFDMLGEEARTNEDAQRYYELYKASILMCANRNKRFKTTNCYNKDNISVKLSALYARYQTRQYQDCLEYLYPRLLKLCILAKRHELSLTIDAEEMDRLELSLVLISKLLTDKELKGWLGLGIVVQAYGKRALKVINYLYELAKTNDRKISIRLVKGAYWDKEIKISQEKGQTDFPVFTQKSHTDISYIYLASELLKKNDRIFAQFASHNANTLLSVLELIEKQQEEVEIQNNKSQNKSVEKDKVEFELQRILGMGRELHDIMINRIGQPCRVYAPIGNHNDLLPYLLRRILENGVNSSFIHQLSDNNIDPYEISYDPYNKLQESKGKKAKNISFGSDIFQPQRINSKSLNLDDFETLSKLDKTRLRYIDIDKTIEKEATINDILSVVADNVNKGNFLEKTEQKVESYINLAKDAQQKWQKVSPTSRARIFNKVADLIEKNQARLFVILAKEGGKTIDDSLSEIREAVDFIRFYSNQLTKNNYTSPRGIVLCIAPWNFPLAIFSGQVVAALLTGNAVIAKPSENCQKIAKFVISLMYTAGVPKNLIQFTAAYGKKVSQELIAKSYLDMIVFTGSNKTATSIIKTIADSKRPDIPFIAETGGLNCMIVDSTCLIERAVDDIINSAFHSAGQRCSALRLVYVQEEIAKPLLDMLKKAAGELKIGHPWFSQTDIGGIITKQAADEINQYILACEQQKRLIWQYKNKSKQTESNINLARNGASKQSFVPPKSKLNTDPGKYVYPAIIKVEGISEMQKEIFGPVLHFATFKTTKISQVVDEINQAGYGLTFGLQTRNSLVINQVCLGIKCGNIYVNRNQIGAIVGSQPFGGMGLSGTGPKAGGDLYLNIFNNSNNLKLTNNNLRLPSPVGETNIYNYKLKDKILIIGNDLAVLINYLNFITRAAKAQMGTSFDKPVKNERVFVRLITKQNSPKLFKSTKKLADIDIIELEIIHRDWSDHDLNDIEAICFADTLNGANLTLISNIKKYLISKSEIITPVLVSGSMLSMLLVEKLICRDITVSGGNIELLTSEIN